MSNLVARSEAQGFLIHLHGASRWVGWLRFARHPSGAVLDQITQVLAKVPVVATIGEPGEGLIGFRQSRSDALEAAGLRQRFPRLPSVLRFRDVRLEALLMRDEESARRFVVDELGELAGIGERLAIARETLLTWLVTGSSSQAAAALWIHENTVRVRTAQAEEMLPGELRTRRAEVLAALRLRAMFDGEPPAG
jgi:DNA-binding PucR family transcriptional regulator